MSKEQELAVEKSRLPFWINMAVILGGIGMHAALMATFGDQYLAALNQSVLGASHLLGRLWGEIRAGYDWCFKYTGWFFFPLAGCIGYSGWTLGRFLEADWRQQPFPKQECKRRYDAVAYIGVEQAALLGFAGTIIYIIAGLGLMAKAMMAMAISIGGGALANGGVNNLPFEQLAQAALFLVPALGTTFAPLVSEAMINHVGRIIQKWHGTEEVCRQNNAARQLPPQNKRLSRPEPNSRLAIEIMQEREASHGA